MAKKRDSAGTGHDWRQVEVVDDEAGERQPPGGGVRFAEFDDGPFPFPDRGWEAWNDDQETAPDLFADASDEDRMQANGEHQGLDEEGPKESPELPSDLRRR